MYKTDFLFITLSWKFTWIRHLGLNNSIAYQLAFYSLEWMKPFLVAKWPFVGSNSISRQSPVFSWWAMWALMEDSGSCCNVKNMVCLMSSHSSLLIQVLYGISKCVDSNCLIFVPHWSFGIGYLFFERIRHHLSALGSGFYVMASQPTTSFVVICMYACTGLIDFIHYLSL